MSLAPNRATARQRYFHLVLLAVVLLLSSCLTAFAQGGVGSTRGLPESNGGINIIKGRVYFPVEPKEGKRVKVKLTSNEMSDQTVLTDDDGVFQFNRLLAGHYTIIVDGGKEFDSAVEAVSIDREASVGGRNMNVAISLKLKGTANAFGKIPKEARDLYSKGMDAAAKGDSKKAAEQLDKAVTLYPQFPQALSDLGVQYLKLGKPDKAAESFEAALKITPEDTNARLSYGIALMNQKKFAEAEAQLRQVLQKNNAMPTAHMYLGITLLTSSRDEKTKQYDMAKYAEAQKELEIAVSTGKDEVAMAHRYLGGIYAGNKDYKRGADELETYLKLSPKAPDAERLKAAISDLRSKH
ncbi:MAG TPA: tetratricopeptide repeat protein [Pyrinomonadaceae bacterium]|nr:tetratricopeptide repeat protein [Pyrinomonadaceae bacterium]